MHEVVCVASLNFVVLIANNFLQVIALIAEDVRFSCHLQLQMSQTASAGGHIFVDCRFQSCQSLQDLSSLTHFLLFVKFPWPIHAGNMTISGPKTRTFQICILRPIFNIQKSLSVLWTHSFRCNRVFVSSFQQTLTSAKRARTNVMTI